MVFLLSIFIELIINLNNILRMKDFYDLNGYFSPLKIYNAKEANFFRNKLEDSEKKLGKLHYIVKTYTIMKWVYEIATNKILLDFVEEIIGKNILLYNATFIIKEPNTKTHVSWHQDLTYWGFDLSLIHI